MGMLEGKVAPVTGGSKGLGAATARLFAEVGARVDTCNVENVFSSPEK